MSGRDAPVQKNRTRSGRPSGRPLRLLLQIIVEHVLLEDVQSAPVPRPGKSAGIVPVQDLPDVGPEQEAEIKAQVEEELQLKLEALPDGTGQEMAEEAEALRLKEAAATSEE